MTSPVGPVLRGRADGRSIDFSRDGVNIGAATSGGAPLRIAFAHANPSLPEGVDVQSSHTNYLLGNDSLKWRVGVANYGRVAYKNLFPGIDAYFYGSGHNLEHDFVVAPKADYRSIRLHFSPGSRLKVDNAGALHVATVAEEFELHRPYVYQVEGTSKRVRTGSFELFADGEVGFSIGAYDRTRPLVIDPILTFSTYVAAVPGSGTLVATDAAGDTYVAGISSSTFPTTPGAYSCSGCGTSGAITFISKISPDGTKLLYSTILGGNGFAQPTGLSIDSRGNILVSGWTDASNFPTKNGLPTDLTNNNSVGFLISLTPDGTDLNFGTLFGCKPTNASSGDTNALALALDASDDVYVTGISGNGFATTQGALNNQASTTSYGDDYNVFLVKFTSAGRQVYSAILGVADPQNGGGGPIGAYALAVDAAGDAFVAGQAGTLWPITSGAYLSTIAGDMPYASPFVSKVSPDGSSLLYSTFLDYAYVVAGITARSDGSVLIAGNSPSANYPTTAAAYQANSGKAGAFVTQVNATGSALVYSTVLGNPSFQIHGFSLGPDGSLWLAAQSGSSAYPLANPVQGTFPTSDFSSALAPVVSQFDPTFKTLEFSTFLGGVANGYASAVAVDSAGRAHIAGSVGYGSYATASAETSSVAPPGQGFEGETFPFAALLDTSVAAPSLCVAPNNVLTFGATAVKGYSERQLKITNCGTQPLSVSSVTAGAAMFTVPISENTCTQTLSPGQSCSLYVRYTPTTVETNTSTLALVSNASETTQTMSLTGNGVLAPVLQVSPLTLAFAPQVSGTTAATQTLTITNVGGAMANDLTFQGLNAAGFLGTTTCGTNLAAGASCTVVVGFAPQAPGIFNEPVFIYDAIDAPFTQVQVSLSGVSPASGFSFVSSAQSTSATVQAGTTASYSLSLASVSGFKGNLSFACGTLPQYATCSISPASVPLAGSMSAAVDVRIATQTVQTSAVRPYLERGSAFLALMLLPFLRTRKGARLVLPAFLLVLMGMSGCGGSSVASPAPPSALKVVAGTYTIPFTVSDGTNQITQNLTLVVQ